MSTVMTIGSSWAGSIALKSLFVMVIGGFLRQVVVEAKFTNCTMRRCFFQAELEHSALAKPATINLITSLTSRCVRSSLLECLLVWGHCFGHLSFSRF